MTRVYGSSSRHEKRYCFLLGAAGIGRIPNFGNVIRSFADWQKL